MEYLRTGPTPWVSSSQPSSSSIGDPQLPICTNSQGNWGFRIASAVPGIQIVRIDEIQILIVLPRDHGELAVDLARKQRHALVLRGGPAEGHQPE